MVVVQRVGVGVSEVSTLPRPAVERTLAKSFSAKPGVEDRTKQRLLTMETCFWMLSTPIFVSHLVYNLCHTGKSVDDY